MPCRIYVSVVSPSKPIPGIFRYVNSGYDPVLLQSRALQARVAPCMCIQSRAESVEQAIFFISFHPRALVFYAIIPSIFTSSLAKNRGGRLHFWNVKGEKFQFPRLIISFAEGEMFFHGF